MGSRHRRQLQALHAIAQILARTSNQHEMLQETLNLLERQLGMVRGTIMLVSVDGTELVVETVGASSSSQTNSVRYQRGEGITGRVFETGRAAVIERISAEQAFLDRIHRRQLSSEAECSFICVPILLGNEVVGTLSIDLAHDPALSLEEEAQVLGIVGGMIANDVQSRRAALGERESLQNENDRLLSELKASRRPENMIGNSHAMRDVYMRIHQVAGSGTTVMIRGESGTGKELAASAIHYSSPRAGMPLVRLNCAALSESLIESELFGHEKGAFTGALYARKGRIEEAEGGTLFFDEIGDFSPAVQVKLLRVLQEREYERIGSNKPLKADVRIIAATNRDLEAMVRDGVFRQDLYYRIHVFPIYLPALRERPGDILLLANHFVEKYAHGLGKPIQRISTPAINMLAAYHWPGNVRELENCIEHAVLLSDDGVIHGHNLPPTLQFPEASSGPAVSSMKARVQALERDMIVDALKRSSGSIARAAEELGITDRMVRYKIKTLEIDYKKLFRKKRL